MDTCRRRYPSRALLHPSTRAPRSVRSVRLQTTCRHRRPARRAIPRARRPIVAYLVGYVPESARVRNVGRPSPEDRALRRRQSNRYDDNHRHGGKPREQAEQHERIAHDLGRAHEVAGHAGHTNPDGLEPTRTQLVREEDYFWRPPRVTPLPPSAAPGSPPAMPTKITPARATLSARLPIVYRYRQTLSFYRAFLSV
jgi:hypothetical protein